MRQRGVRGHQILLAIRDAAVVLAPRYFGRIGVKVAAREMVMRPDLRAAQA
jgi:hypothetical protein